ncbi:hypothetical protein [Mesorhizobium sp. f-mel]
MSAYRAGHASPLFRPVSFDGNFTFESLQAIETFQPSWRRQLRSHIPARASLGVSRLKSGARCFSGISRSQLRFRRPQLGSSMVCIFAHIPCSSGLH